MEAGTPPGWYPDERDDKWLRYWDGKAWTDEFRMRSRDRSMGAPRHEWTPEELKPPLRSGSAPVIGYIALGMAIFCGVIIYMVVSDPRDQPDTTETAEWADPPDEWSSTDGVAGSDVQDPDATPPGTSDRLLVVGDIEIPDGPPGEVSVVLLGAVGDAGWMPLVVRNMTEHTVTDIDVFINGDDDGEEYIAVWASPTMPFVVAPGEYAFTEIEVWDDFDELEFQIEYELAPSDAEYEVGVFDELVRQRRVEVTGPRSRFIGFVSSSDGDAFSGSHYISVLCVSGGRLEGVFPGFTMDTDYSDPQPRQAAPFSATAWDSRCENYAIGAEPRITIDPVEAEG